MSKVKPSRRRDRPEKTGRIILVLGGTASGKSETALRLAGAKRPKAFVATGEGLDDEMAVRISRHQAARGSKWITAEVPVEVSAWFSQQGKAYRTIVLDCVTLWLSNLQGRQISAIAVAKKVDELLAAMQKAKATVVIVSNELGLGLVPVEKPARKFRDLAGRMNQQIAAAADEVHFVVSGVSLRLK
jgi:adenosylcobinamide kinase / adenosylcobinamide-phosphate guanylyltransferase